MRRIRRDETLHGTRHGQIAIDRALVEARGLTEREAVCASLIKQGFSLGEIAESLAISTSTAEKHLGALRRKLGVSTTREAAILLLRNETEASARIADGFGPVPAVDAGFGDGLEAERLERLRSALTLEGVLRETLSELDADGARALFYYFLPLSIASLRKADVIACAAAGEDLARQFRENDGWAASGIAARLFAEPDGVILVDAESADETGAAPSLVAACRAEGLRFGITLGSPYGTGYFVSSALYRATPAETFRRGLDGRIERLRNEARLAHNAAYAFGALAREAGLTVRERDALSLLAEGHATKAAAASLGISERAFGQLSKSAREKLGAATTAEAIAKAMALNALVFL